MWIRTQVTQIVIRSVNFPKLHSSKMHDIEALEDQRQRQSTHAPILRAPTIREEAKQQRDSQIRPAATVAVKQNPDAYDFGKVRPNIPATTYHRHLTALGSKRSEVAQQQLHICSSQGLGKRLRFDSVHTAFPILKTHISWTLPVNNVCSDIRIEGPTMGKWWEGRDIQAWPEYIRIQSSTDQTLPRVWMSILRKSFTLDQSG